MDIKNHKLQGDHIEQLNCPKNKQQFAPGDLDTIIIHYTAGRNAKSSASYLAKNNVKASAHVVLGTEGEMYQLVPFDTMAWHAGKSSYGGRSGFNHYSIGIEIDNAGLLTKTENGYKTWFGSDIPASEVIKAKHRNEITERYWEAYTEAQIDMCYRLCDLLMDHYRIKYVLGHEEISPGRKQDPGPAFPLDKMRNHLLYNDRETEMSDSQSYIATVWPEKLNIRTGPGTSFAMVSDPLDKGTQLTVLDEVDGWYKVETSIKGWVAKDYVQR
jgi:N-acetylmuramoyl-L-alanine amidase